MIRSKWMTALVLVMAVAPVGVRAEDPLPDILREVGIDQRLNENIPLDLAFHDETGKSVRLGDYFDGKQPVILVLVQYRCPMLCNQVLNGLVDGLREIPLTMGEQYRVVTVSFDAREEAGFGRRQEGELRRKLRPHRNGCRLALPDR